MSRNASRGADVMKEAQSNNIKIWNPPVDGFNHMFIKNKAFGCSLCPDGSFSYFSRPGSDDYHINHYDHKQNGFMLNQNCQKINEKEGLPSYAVGKNWFHTYLE
jgi:hypothetical protein